MEPADLSEDELNYELEIRGKHNINDKRLATKTLRAELDQEKKGEKIFVSNNLKPLEAREFLLPLELVVEGLRKELSGAVGRDAVNAKRVLTSKLLHYLGRVNRLHGSDAGEVKRIENLQDEIKKCLDASKDRLSNNDRSVFTSYSRVQRSPTESTGAIPKAKSHQAAAIIDLNISNESQTMQQNVDQHQSNSLITTVQENSGNSESRQSNNVIMQGQRDFIDKPNHNRSRREADRRIDGSVRAHIGDVNLNSMNAKRIDGVQRANFNAIINNTDQMRAVNNIIERERGNNGVQAHNTMNHSFIPGGVSNNNIMGRQGYNDSSYENYNYYQQQRGPPYVNAVNRPQFAEYGGSAGDNPFINATHQNQRFNNNFFQHSNYPNNNNNSFDRVQHLQPQLPQPQPQFRRRNPVADWNLFFSGDKKDMSVNDFLSRVALYARAEKVTGDELMSSAIYLFKGKADIWFRAFSPYFNTWDQLVQGLKAQFLPVDYDFWLLKEIEQRLQGETEDFGIFSAAMEMMFRNLTNPLSERQKLDIVMRNMLPMYSDRLSLMYIDNIPQLGAMCKRIEESKYRINRQIIPQIERCDLLEPAYSYHPPSFPRHSLAIEPDFSQVAQITYRGQRTFLCYNCGEPGHHHNQCRSERKLFCYKCGLVGYVSRNCVRCHAKDRGNADAGSNQGVRQNPQSTQTQTPL